MSCTNDSASCFSVKRENADLRMKFVNVNRHAQYVERANESLKAELDRVLGEQEEHAPDTWERIIEDALDGYHDTDFEKLVSRCKKLAGDAE